MLIVKVIFTIPKDLDLEALKGKFEETAPMYRDTKGLIRKNYICDLDKSIGVASLGQLNYLSALQYVDFVIGNSSSGLLEVPSFRIGTINIGDRQNGRIKADSVVDCLPNKKSIKKAIKIVYSKKFQKFLKDVKNPYGDGCASEKIVKVLKTVPLEDLLKKVFFNIKFSL